MRYSNHTKDLHIQLSIINEQGDNVKTITISLDDYIDETIGKKCQNVADNLISDMLKNIIHQKQINNVQ